MIPFASLCGKILSNKASTQLQVYSITRNNRALTTIPLNPPINQLSAIIALLLLLQYRECNLKGFKVFLLKN